MKKGVNFTKILSMTFMSLLIICTSSLPAFAGDIKGEKNITKVDKNRIRALAKKRTTEELKKITPKKTLMKGIQKRQLGCSKYRPPCRPYYSVPGNYDWDCPIERAYWYNHNGNWYIYHYGRRPVKIIQFGLPGDIPIPADYDNDGRTEAAVYRPSTGMCHISLYNESWPVGAVAVRCRRCR